MASFARAVLQLRRDLRDAAGLLHALGDDAGEGRDVHVAAGDDRHGLEVRVDLVEEVGGDARGASALGDGLRALQQADDRGCDLVLGDGHDFVNVFFHDGERQVARRQHMDAVGDRGSVLHGGHSAAAVGDEHGGNGGRLHADDLHVGAHGLDRHGHAADESAAADGNDDLLHVGHLVENLKADRALTGDDIGIVERVGEGVALGLAQTGRLGRRVVIHARHEHDLRAVAAGGLDLQQGRALGHADHGLDAESRRGQRHALRMVAGGAGDHALRGLLGGELADLVEGAADLERTGLLQVLRLDIKVLAQAGRGDDRGQLGHALKRFSCLLDHFQSDFAIHSNTSFLGFLPTRPSLHRILIRI